MNDAPIPFQNAKVVGTGIDSDAYHAPDPDRPRGHPEFVMSRSELMLFASCPSRWMRGYKPKDSDATDYGSILDCLLLDKDRFGQKFSKQPLTCKATKTMTCVKDGEAKVGDEVPWSPNSSEAREWKRAQGNKIVVTSEELKDYMSAIDRIIADPQIKLLFETSDFQVMVVGEFEADGITVPVKALIDLVPRVGSPHERDLADFKTARDAHPRAWAKAVDQRGYDAQSAFFLDLYNAATGELRNTFLHVVQENVFPFEPDKRMLSVEFLNLGRSKVIGALRHYCACLKTGEWPSWTMERFNGWGNCSPEPYMVLG